jgi:hypothetical protein
MRREVITEIHREEGCVTMDIETGVLSSQAKECWHFHKLEEKERILPEPSKGPRPTHTMNSDFRPLELEEDDTLLF